MLHRNLSLYLIRDTRFNLFKIYKIKYGFIKDLETRTLFEFLFLHKSNTKHYLFLLLFVILRLFSTIVVKPNFLNSLQI